MATRAALASLDDLARMLPGFCLRHGIARVEVFGSVAKGQTREGSDLDLMVTFRRGVRPGLGFFAMQEELEQILGCPVDLLTRLSKAIAPFDGARFSNRRVKYMPDRQAAYLLDILNSADAIGHYLGGVAAPSATVISAGH